ncbi:MAG: DUF368 domain-containing protein [Bacilli bacterium]|nr:DUF368 domain-containing protein [Bacilli bacterium]
MMLVNNTIIRGFVYGLSSILPGLSGGFFAVMFGDYKKLINIISKCRVLGNIRYIINLSAGFILGVLLGARFIRYLIGNFNASFKLSILIIFICSIIGFIRKYRINFYIIISSIAISLIINFVEVPFNMSSGLVIYGLAGVIYSVSKIIPGISATVIFINLSFYDNFIGFINNPFSSFAICKFEWIIFFVFFMITSIILVRIVSKFLDKTLFKFIVLSLLYINLINLLK